MQNQSWVLSTRPKRPMERIENVPKESERFRTIRERLQRNEN